MQEHWTVTSPNGRVVLTMTETTDPIGGSRFGYAVALDGRPVLDEGRLGILTENADFAAGMQLESSGEEVLVEDAYTLVHGKQRNVEARGTERTFVMRSGTGEVMALVMRAYDSGIAFRYRFSESRKEPVRATDELTEFAFATEGRAWALPHQLPDVFGPAYENAYVDGVDIGHGAPVPGWLFPALFETDDAWVLLTESDLDGTYAAGHLRPNPVDLTYRMALPQPSEGFGLGNRLPENGGAWQTPWRVAVIGDLATVFESTLVQDLARPADLEDTSWIRPGRVSWSWWSDHDSPRNVAALKDFVDLAAEMGWEHTLIDANWNLMPKDDLEEVLSYGRSRNVGVFLWYNSGGPNNRVTEEPRDRMYEPAVRQQEMARLKAMGVAGLKVDFFHSDKQAGIQLYLGILADAADAELMMNFHGSTIPRGWDRTYPHLMTMEGVRGAEQYDFRPTYPAEAPWHNVVLAFTRNVVGPMDYTPVTFSDGAYPHITSNGHELALSVVFESGLQHFADSADSYRAQPAAVRDYLSRVPSVWDETRLLAGEPGRFIVVARRSGPDWFIAGISGAAERLDLAVNLDGLGLQGPMTLLTDADGPRSWSIDARDASGELTLKLQPFGGFAAVTASPDGGS